MPRPGPRPFECVKRAWHSERHQPIRGSLIQEIFRIVNEVHSPATRKNKEWQEKLPIVVLKAEEIMYSKANSEVEYMDLQTLWDRANEAINIIIRRDESYETTQLLHPCIEAALNLGCTARRASRSQRNTNPRPYLKPNSKEIQIPINFPRRIPEERNQRNQTPNQKFISHNQNITQPSNMNSNDYNRYCADEKFQFSSEKSLPSSNLCSLYSSCRGSNIETEECRFDSKIRKKLNSAAMENAEIGTTEDRFSSEFDASYGFPRMNMDTKERPIEIECDLSLRLSLFSAP